MSDNNDDDDDFGEEGCSSVFFGKFFYTESSSGQVFLGTPHLFTAFIISCLLYYNHILLKRQKETANANIVSFLILPSYLPLLYYFAIVSAIFGMIDFILRYTKSDTSTVMVFIYPLQIALLHWLYEGLSLFFTNYGAGIYAIQRALKFSFIWICYTFIWFFIIFSIGQSKYHIEDNYQRGKDHIYALLMIYVLILFLYYFIYSFINPKLLYSRPSMQFYSRASALFYGTFAILISIYHNDQHDVECPSSIILFILVSFMKPILIYRALIIDSQYWQGLLPHKENPVNEVWDHLGVETATTLADNLTVFQQTNRKLPILHFGLIQLDKDLTFVAGGFSRVYFGTVKHRKVALKLLFAMELEPQSIKEFYTEASILYKLRHENVVECLGICVMPPALTMVLEHCKYGSLFDFLYKPVISVSPDVHTLLKSRESSWRLSRTTNPVIASDSSSSSNDSGSGGGYSTGGSSSVPSSGSNDRGGGRTMSRDIELQQIITQSSSSGGTALAMNTIAMNDLNPNDTSLTMNPLSLQEQQQQDTSVRHISTDKILQRKVFAEVNDGDNTMLGTDKQQHIASGLVADNRYSYNSNRGSSIRGSGVGYHIGGASMGNHSFLGRMSEILKNPFSSSGNTSKTQIMQPLGLGLILQVRLNMMKDAVNAIAFLHKQGYLHCDLKSLNFLVAENYVLKLADMGEVRPIKGSMKTNMPSPAKNWSPPECLVPGNNPEMYTMKSDIYGLAIVLSEILTSEIPFGRLPDLTPNEQWHHMIANENLRPNLPDNLPKEIKKIVESCWAGDPNDRPSAEEVLQVLIDYKIFMRDIESNSNE